MAGSELKVTGRYLGASAPKTVGSKGTLVRSFWVDITTNPEWPNTPQFELRGAEKCALPDALNQGQEIEVHFNITGRKWEKDGRSGVFTQLDCWRITTFQRTNVAGQDAYQSNPSDQEAAPLRHPRELPANLVQGGNDEDLPF